MSVAENFVLPGYIEKVTDDELTEELWRLEKTEAAEEKKVFPESVKTSYTEDGKTIPLTAEQRNKRQKVAGQKGREYIEAFYNTVRIHSHCNYMSPDQFEKLYLRLLAA